MVDFKKHVGKKTATKVLDPAELYETLDRASDKGPLRPAQRRILVDWHAKRRGEQDVILKLHTGQGKTLLGLLMLQSKLNEGTGPALYLCPNNFLVGQTLEQAKQFGIKCVTAAPDLPDEFIEGRAILVAVVHKLFNGLTRFGLGHKSLPAGTVLLDDSHACIDAIKDQFAITLRHGKSVESTAYGEIRSLFEDELRAQGDGTYEDILRGDFNAYLPVPYWDWWDKSSEVAGILSRHAKIDAIKYAWPLLKDALRHTLCLVSGTQLTITPRVAPLDQFGTYYRAKHRIFMSATVTDDSFLVKGLGLDSGAVLNPLMDPTETWSGEKMVLIPSRMDDRLGRSHIVGMFARESPDRSYGVAALVPSAKRCADWGKYGARVVDKKTIEPAVTDLRRGVRDKALVVANYYDGIDLPDDSCRILVLDSRPFAEDLPERHLEDRVPGSDLVAGRIARIVEQGMGRAVRGEKDYCVVVLTGPDLIRSLFAPGQREFFSDQTRTQIEIGRDVADLAKGEIEEGGDPSKAFRALVRQCLGRDPDWKAFYSERMDGMETRAASTNSDLLDTFESELAAERAFRDGDLDLAATTTQALLDGRTWSGAERGWYLQETARYTYPASKTQSMDLQKNAHKLNHALLRPKEGMIVTKVPTLTPEKRLESIADWISSLGTFESVATRVDDIVARLRFGVIADRFELALQELAGALGFASDRPDKDWKEGPDNLWGLRDDQYLLFECKNRVEMTRAEVNKRETDQMNRSSAWFGRHYPGSSVTRTMIIPTRKLASAAAFTTDVLIMTKPELELLTNNVRAFFNEFRGVDLRDLSLKRIDGHLQTHRLTVDDLVSQYGVKPVARGR